MSSVFRGPTGFSENNEGGEGGGGGGDNSPSTSSGIHQRPSNNGQSKPKTQNQLKYESIAQQIISEIDGCAYDFR